MMSDPADVQLHERTADEDDLEEEFISHLPLSAAASSFAADLRDVAKIVAATQNPHEVDWRTTICPANAIARVEVV